MPYINSNTPYPVMSVPQIQTTNKYLAGSTQSSSPPGYALQVKSPERVFQKQIPNESLVPS